MPWYEHLSPAGRHSKLSNIEAPKIKLKCCSDDFDQACNAEHNFKTLWILISELLVRLSDQVCTVYISNGGVCHHKALIEQRLGGNLNQDYTGWTVFGDVVASVVRPTRRNRHHLDQ